MANTLPNSPSVAWLKKTAKQILRTRRAEDPRATLAAVQRDMARDYGFRSWRALKAHVESLAWDDRAVAGFLRAVGEGRGEEVRSALSAQPWLVNAVGPHPFWGGRPQPLHVAIETKRRDLFDLLLDAGGDVDGSNEDYDHWSPLMLAVSRDRSDMVAILLERGAQVGILEALMIGDDEELDRLLAGGVPKNLPHRETILAFARTPHAIDRLLDLGADPNARGPSGVTAIGALSRAGEKGRELVRHMMIRGAVAQPKELARLGDLGTLEMLIEAHPDIVESGPVLVAAVVSGNFELVRWLLARGANPNGRATDEAPRHTALHEAAWQGNLAVAQLLVEAGAERDVRDAKFDSTPWGWAKTAVKMTNNPACEDVAAWLETIA